MKKTKNEALDEEKKKKILERKKKKAIKTKKYGHNFFYYLKPAHFMGEITGYGYRPTMMSILGRYAAFILLGIGMSIVFELQIPYAIALLIAEFLFIPSIIVSSYRKLYEQKRFDDISMYMEQFLYSFNKNKLVVKTLQDIRLIFPNSPIGDLLDKAIEHILQPSINESQVNAVEEALKMIEAEYPASKVKAIHKFALRAERTGGNYDKITNLLLKDREAWVLRTIKTQDGRKQRKTIVIGSIMISVFLVAIFFRMLPMAMNDVSIAHNVLVQVLTVAMWFSDFLIYDKANRLTNVDMMLDHVKDEEESALRKYYKIVNHDPAKGMRTSIKYTIIFGIATLLTGLVTFKATIYFMPFFLICAMFLGISPFQDKLDQYLARASVTRQIEDAFPIWLIDIALYLQTKTSVKVAIYKSYNSAPLILRPELEKLYNNINLNPTGIEPYLEFMKTFDVKAVQSAMKMLYGINNGAGGDASEQIPEILEQNNQMLDRNEMKRLENQLAKYSVLFLIPVLTAGFKLMADMMVFFSLIMAQLGNMTGL